MAAPQAFGNFPVNQLGAYGAGQPYMPPGSNLQTSGFTKDADFNRRVEEAAKLLGPPPDLSDKDPRSRFPRELVLLPERWAGPDGSMQSNKYLTESVIFFHDDAMREIVSVLAPPVLFLGNPTMKMKQLTFNRAKVDKYTHTGVPRLVTFQWDTWDAAIPRIGLGAEFDEELIGLPEGTELIKNSIKQIQYAVIDHCGTEATYAFIHAHPQPQNFYEAQNLPVPREMAYQNMQPELEHWGIMQKTEFAVAKLATYAKKQIARQQGSAPDIVVTPSEVADYHRFSRPELTNYMRQGEKGPARQEQGGNAVMQPQLGGIRMIGAPLIPNEDMVPRDPLVWPRMIGEKFLMDANVNPHVIRQNATQVEAEANRQAADALRQTPEYQLAMRRLKVARTVYIHDNPSDTMKPITIAAIQGYFRRVIGAVGANPIPEDLPARLVEAFALLLPNQAQRADNVARAAQQPAQAALPLPNPPLPAAVEEALVMIQSFVADGNNIEDWDDYHVLLVRPYMLYRMAMFIFAKAGGETAETHIGYGDARWGHDATRKKAILHYTTYSGCVIKRPQNIWVANCVHAQGHLGGGGIRLGVDLFPILVPRGEFVQGYQQRDCDLISAEPFMGITADAFSGIIDDANAFVLSNVAVWQTFYEFRRNPDGVMHNVYRGMQQFNARVFTAHMEFARVNEDGAVVAPRGQHVIGRGHWGPWSYDGVAMAREGKGHTPYVCDPYASRVQF